MNQHFYFIWLLSFCCRASLVNGFHPGILLGIAREMVPVESFQNCFEPLEDQRSCLDSPMNWRPGPQNSSDTLLSLVDIKQSLINDFCSILDSPLSPVDVNQGLVTNSERRSDYLLSPVNVKQGLITEIRLLSDEVSVASERQTSAQQERRLSDEVSVASERQTSQQQLVPQYDTPDFVSEDANKTNSNEVSFELGYLSTIGA